jgi:hypothetical protein
VHQRFGRALAHADQLAGLVAAHADDRMAQHMHADAGVGQRHGHRIDQERHVVVDDLHQGVGGVGRVAQAHIGLAALAAARELQHVGGQFGPAGRVAAGDLVGIHAPVEGGGERLRLGQAGLAHALGQRIEDGFQVVAGTGFD